MQMTPRERLIQKMLQLPDHFLEKVDDYLTELTSIDDSRRSFSLAPGLSIYRLRNSRFFWSRVRLGIPGVPELRQSTGETDFERAKIKGFEARAKIIAQAEKGVAIEGRGFTVKTLCDKIITEIKNSKTKRTTHADYINTYEQYIIPAVGHLAIRQLDAAALKAYFEDTTLRSKTRLVIQRACFTRLFDYAVINRYLQQRDVPKVPVVQAKDKDTIREVFDVEDLKVIREGFTEFILSSVKGVTLQYRELLPSYFEFLLATGIRPGNEPLSLRWRDLRTRQIKLTGSDETALIWSVQVKKGKTESSGGREVVLSDEAIQALHACFEARNTISERLSYIVKNYGDDVIFSSETGKRPPFEKIFAQYMEQMAPRLRYSAYTLYCCRHTYINDALARGVSHATIAKNCGNSVTTIEKHYEKLTSMLKANELINVQAAGRAMDSQKMGFLESDDLVERIEPELSKEEMDLINSGWYDSEPTFSIEEDEAFYNRNSKERAKEDIERRKGRLKK